MNAPTILVIEDDPRLLDNVVDLLDLHGYKTLSALHGQQGLELARTHQPDLILCDVMMPEMNGYAVLEALRGDAATATVPFVFLTALSERSGQRYGMELGADDYLTKPFVETELLQSVEARLKRKQALALQQERAVDRFRNRLAQVVPHELRTPLTAIRGCTDLLLLDWHEMEPEVIHEMLSSIGEASLRLERLVDNYSLYVQVQLALADPEASTWFQATHRGPVDQVAGQVARACARCHDRLADLHLDVAPGPVQMPESHQRKLLEEVIGNAFKFSPAGTPVTITGQAVEASYELLIADQGSGMTAQQLAQTGHAFTQFERAQWEQRGLGLGLALAHSLAEIYAGRLNVQSQSGAGTTVRLVLPV
ncbi:MAG: hybrid sensor histidine kinase/response regulator [Bacteroidota bacterium]